MRDADADATVFEDLRPVWRAPQMTRFEAEDAENGTNTIADAGLASS